MQLAVYTRLVKTLGRPFRRFRVADTSMQPTLRPGDHLLVLTWCRSVRPGNIVVVRDPEAASAFLVKRALRTESNGDVVVGGDSPNVSRDSRHFGPVPGQLIVGRAIYRYSPPNRRGRL